MLTAVYLILSVIHLLFVLAAVRLFLRNRSIYTAVAALVIFGLFYDNLIIGLGRSIGEGQALQSLNAGRFIIHALVTPLLIMFAVATAQRLGLGWAQSRTTFAVFGVLTLLMIGLGIYTDIINLSLSVAREAGTLRYVNANSAGPPIPAIVTILVMIVVGASVWRRHKWAVLCLGAILMFILAGAGASVLILGNVGEILFAGSILWTDYKLGDLVARMRLNTVPLGA
jgi:hypothetical protein